MNQLPASGKRAQATAERRKTILEAGFYCFLEKGYSQTGVRDIAARAGVSLGNLYNHFSSKQDILIEMAALERKQIDRFVTLLTGKDAPPALVRKFIESYANYLAQPENVILAIEIIYQSVREPDIGDLFTENRKRLNATLAKVIEQGMASGEFRAEVDPTGAALIIMEMIESAACRCVLVEVGMATALDGVTDFAMAALHNKPTT